MARIWTALAARGFSYDRTPLRVSRTLNSQFDPPAGATLRVSYTVPTNRKAILNSVYVQIIRDGPAAAPGTADIRCGFSTNIEFGVSLNYQNGAVGAFPAVFQSPQAFVAAGTQIGISTEDFSGDGTHWNVGSFVATEFDV